MTTGPEELSLNYLLDPAFQLVNTAGRPLTNGWIEVYYHGTRDKYYCASDFDGTLHPFRIPLDSLGSNIVLADPNFSYDIYVYNSFGSLQMSRYNVNPGSGSGGGSSGEGGPAEHWSSDTAGGASTTVTGGTTVYLTLPSSEDQPEFVDHATDTAIFLKEGLYHIDAVVSFKQDEDDLQNIIKDLVVNTGLIGWDAQMTGQKNWTGPESTDDDRHFLELHTVVSVPEDSLQNLYFQISSPVDLDSAAIEKLDIIKLEAGSGGRRYAPGYGIQIEGQVISTSGMMPEASAANFVDNSTYQVDIQNIYDTIAETSAMIPSGVATEQWVTDYTSAFITSADLPDLSDYATQQWVEDKGYITSADIPPIPQDVITSGELATVSGDIVSQIPSLDGYATQQWVNEQNFITSADLPQSVPLVAGEGISIVDTSASTIISIDSAYSPGVSEEWVEDYVSNATSGFITSADIPDVPEDLVTSAELATVSGDIVSQIPDVSDMATQTWVNEQGFLTSLPEDLVTSGELATVSGDIMSQIPTQTTVSIDPTLSSGTKIAEFNINGTSGELFAPEGGGSSSPDVFIAEAFVTPYQDVLDAHDAGKTIFAHYDGSYGGAPNATYVLSTKGYNSFYFTCIQAEDRQGAYLKTISVTPSGWATGSYFQYAVPTPIVTNPVGSVLTKVDANNNMGWTVPQSGGSEVDIIPSLSSGTKIADYVIDGTSGELYAPDGGSTYNGIKPISVQGSDISLMYGETLTCPDPDPIQCEYRNGKDGDYAYFNNSSYEIESTNSCDIVFPNSTTVEGTSGNTLRLRLTDEINSLYINGTVNLVSNGGTAYLDGSTQTFNLRSSLWRPSGRTWDDMFDFSQYSLSDIEGDIRIELWEFNGDTPVQHLEMGNNPLLIYTNAVQSYLNVTYPVPSPTYNQGYVLTENGDGTYGWAQGGGSVPEDVVTSGQLATVSGEIMSQMPSQTTVSIDPTLSSGTKIAEFNINGTSGELFAPEGGGSSWSEEYVDIPLYTYSTTTTTWQTIADYASAHGGMAPVGFCEGDGQVYYPTLFQPEYKRVRYVSIYKNPYDSSTTWRFSSKTLEQPFSTSYWKEFVTGYIGQSDWNESNTDSFSYIQNKPDLSSFATSADLVTVSGDIMSQMPTPTSVAIEPTLQTGTKIAEYVIDGTSGELYAPAGGGSVTFPLEVSGSTNVYEARDGLTSGYVNAGEIYVGYHDDGGGGEPDIDTVSITPYQIQVKADWGGISPTMTEVTPGVVTLYDNEGGSQYVDFNKVENWDNTHDAVNNSATYWNSSIFSNQITSAALVNSLPADASAHPNYLYLIPEN